MPCNSHVSSKPPASSPQPITAGSLSLASWLARKGLAASMQHQQACTCQTMRAGRDMSSRCRC